MVFCGTVTDHISSCSPVNGDADDTVTMKDIHIRGLTDLDTVGNNVGGLLQNRVGQDQGRSR